MTNTFLCVPALTNCAPGFLRAKTLLHQAGGGRKKHVRGNAREDDQINLVGICLGLGQQALCGFRGHVRGGGAILRDVTFLDTGARANPFVIRFDDFFQIRVGHHPWRNVAGYTGNFCREAVGHDAPCELQPGQRR